MHAHGFVAVAERLEGVVLVAERIEPAQIDGCKEVLVWELVPTDRHVVLELVLDPFHGRLGGVQDDEA